MAASYTASPTKAKMPIAAMMRGPGPAKYGLPSCIGKDETRQKFDIICHKNVLRIENQKGC